MKALRHLLLGVIFIAAAGCATMYNPATGQNEFIFITTPTEVSIGKALSAKVSSQYKISKDKEKINRVATIGKKIARASDRRDLTYIFNVIEDETLNAFTLPGGYIYVNTGVLDKATDDELACVIGHEAGHVAARHIAKKLQAQIGYDILMNIALRKSNMAEFNKAVSVSYDLISLGYSREDELLADKLGAKYAYKAGYDPNAMITFLKKMQEIDGKEMGFVFLRSHPYASQRIKTLEKELSAIKESVDNKTNQTDSRIPQAGEDSTTENVTAENVTRDVADADTESRPLKVMCPKCRRIFPGTTIFCPYDGTRLE